MGCCSRPPRLAQKRGLLLAAKTRQRRAATPIPLLRPSAILYRPWPLRGGASSLSQPMVRLGVESGEKMGPVGEGLHGEGCSGRPKLAAGNTISPGAERIPEPRNLLPYARGPPWLLTISLDFGENLTMNLHGSWTEPQFGNTSYICLSLMCDLGQGV